MDSKHSAWKLLDSRTAGDYRIFRLRRDRYEHPSIAEPRDYVVLEAADWVNVVPLTDDGRVVLIRQFRHGIAAGTLEIPGGLVDEGEADPARAARRELREETGYDCRDLELLGSVHPNPAIIDNLCHTYLARGCRPVGDPRPDPSEVIEVELRELAEIPALIAGGEITHALVVAAFHWLDLRQGDDPTAPA